MLVGSNQGPSEHKCETLHIELVLSCHNTVFLQQKIKFFNMNNFFLGRSSHQLKKSVNCPILGDSPNIISFEEDPLKIKCDQSEFDLLSKIDE